MATTSSEITWLCFLLTDLQVSHSHVVVLHCDNKVALHIALNPVFHERTKHVELDCHFIRDKIQEGILITAHVSTKCQLAKFLQKLTPSVIMPTTHQRCQLGQLQELRQRSIKWTCT
jgi:hypothetical protein